MVSLGGATLYSLNYIIFSGDVLRWEQQIRLRHMLTRQYLCIDSRSEVSLIVDPSDPRTVFRLHSVLKVRLSMYKTFSEKNGRLIDISLFKNIKFGVNVNSSMTL